MVVPLTTEDREETIAALLRRYAPATLSWNAARESGVEWQGLFG